MCVGQHFLHFLSNDWSEKENVDTCTPTCLHAKEGKKKKKLQSNLVGKKNGCAFHSHFRTIEARHITSPPNKNQTRKFTSQKGVCVCVWVRWAKGERPTLGFSSSSHPMSWTQHIGLYLSHLLLPFNFFLRLFGRLSEGGLDREESHLFFSPQGRLHPSMDGSNKKKKKKFLFLSPPPLHFFFV